MRGVFGIKVITSSLFSNFFIQLVTILQGIILARLLGPEGRGEVAAIILWPNFFSGIFVFGTKTYIALLSAKNNSKDLFIPVSLLGLITGLLGFIFCYISVPFLLGESNKELFEIARLFSLVIVINHVAGAYLSIDQGRGDFNKYNFSRLILNPLYLTFLVFIFFFDFLSVESTIVSLLVANFVVLLIRLIYLLKEGVNNTIMFSPLRILKQSVSFGLADLAIPIYQYLDQSILIWLLGTLSLGYYTVALTASSVLGVVSTTIATLSFTNSANSTNQDKFVSTFKFTAICFIFLSVALAFFMPILLPMIYGDDFKSAVFPAILLLISAYFKGQGLILEQTYRGASKPFIGLVSRVVSIFLMVFLGYILAPIWGLNGVVVAFIVSQAGFYYSMKSKFDQVFSGDYSLSLKLDDFIKFKLVLIGLFSYLRSSVK